MQSPGDSLFHRQKTLNSYSPESKYDLENGLYNTVSYSSPSFFEGRHIIFVLNNLQILLPCVGADCSGPSRATTIHPTKGSATVTSPAQNFRTPLGIQRCCLHYASFPGSKEHIELFEMQCPHIYRS